MANIIIVLNVKYVIIVSTLVFRLEFVVNAQRKTVCPSRTFTRCCKKCFGAFRNSTCIITWKTVYVIIQSHVTHVAGGSSVQCLITYAIYPIVVIVLNLSNQITSVLLR